MVVSSGLGRSGGSGCWLGCPSVFSSSFVFIGEGVPSSRVCYCVGPGDASECLYLLVGRVEPKGERGGSWNGRD